MSKSEMYLKQNVVAEPLINQWYAWSYLVQPATSAMFVANSHLKVMESFIANPQLHIAALKNPAMIGGPFINYGVERLPEIRSLCQSTKLEQAPALAVAADIKTLDDILSREAQGESLISLYAKIPDRLRGFVELVYDLNNNPSIRFVEGLLYKSDYYDTSKQALWLSLIEGDNRPFVFSTPRLEGEHSLQIRIPFSDERVDRFFAAASSPADPHWFVEAMGLSAEGMERFISFFSERPPQSSERYSGEGVRVRYFGHACVLIETKSTSILIDPLVSYGIDGGIERYTFEDLPDRIDYVLITHNHQDHCVLETLLRIRHKTGAFIIPRSNSGNLADPSLRLILENLGFRNVREIDEMESIEVPDGNITGVPFFGEHADLNIRSKTAYFINLFGNSLMFVADSNNLLPDLYKPVHRALGDVDLLFLGMECDGGPLTWLYGPLLTRALSRKMDQSRRVNGSDSDAAANLVELFNVSRAFVYAMGQEPWLTFLTSIRYTDTSKPIVESNKFIDYCKMKGIASERLYGRNELVLAPKSGH